MNKKRLDYLDMVKGFGIFLVVLGHMEDISTNTRIWISSFHMPLFFIVSGILIAISNEVNKDMTTVFKKKFRGLIIPYLYFSFSYFLIDILNVTIIGNIDFHTFIVDTISSITFYGMSVLWFLPALFRANVSFIFIKKKLNDYCTVVFSLLIAIFSYIFKLQLVKIYDTYSYSLLITSIINIVYIFIRGIIALSFVCFAYYIKKIYDLITDKKNYSKIFCSRIVNIVAGLVLIILNIVLAKINECVDLRNILLNNLLIYYAAALTGSFGVILIFKAFPSIKPLIYIGKNSMIIMVAHVNYYFLYAGIRLAWIIDPYVKHAKHYVFVAIVLVTIFVLSSIVIEIINRYFPFILGKPFENPFKKLMKRGQNE